MQHSRKKRKKIEEDGGNAGSDISDYQGKRLPGAPSRGPRGLTIFQDEDGGASGDDGRGRDGTSSGGDKDGGGGGAYREFLYSGQARSDVPRGITRDRADPSLCAKTIREGAFEDCQQLAEVKLWEGLEVVGRRAFSGCTSLKRVRLPATVKTIERDAFWGCSGLEEAKIGKGPTRIGARAFGSCRSLRRVRIPSTVESICEGAFSHCSRLEAVDLREGLRTIGFRAFAACARLSCIKIPSTVEIIGGMAFEFCNQLVTAEIFEGVEYVSNSAFRNCFSLRNVRIPPAACKGLELCHDLHKTFESRARMEEALAKRFDELPIHKLCYYQSRYPTELVLKQLKEISRPAVIGNNQDCFGMTPLHILACSTKQSLVLHRFITRQQPSSPTTDDKWGCPPLLYAIWADAPEEIVQFLVESIKSSFPVKCLDWGKMIETLSRAGESIETIQDLLRVQKTAFPEQSVDWQRAAKELTIRCLIMSAHNEDPRLRISSFQESREAMMEAFYRSQAYWELVRNLQRIQQAFPNFQSVENMQVMCEHLAEPLKGWCQPKLPLEAFYFLVKFGIPQRLGAIGPRSWRTNIEKMIAGSSFRHSRELEWRCHKIHYRLVAYERELFRLNNAAVLLELALWKANLRENPRRGGAGAADRAGSRDLSVSSRTRCRVNCGADVIVRGVLPFLVDRDEDEHPAWFVERVSVQLKESRARAVIREVEMSWAWVEMEDRSMLNIRREELSMVPPQEHDMVLVTEGWDVGLEGELVYIDGEDAIVKTPSDEFKIVDLVHVVKIGRATRLLDLSGACN